MSIFNSDRLMQLLPHWITDRLGHDFIRLVSKYQVSHTYLVELVFLILLLSFGWYWVLTRMTSRKTVASLVLSILTIRLVLFWNPVSWTIYDESLDLKDMGWRQKSVIIYETKKYFATPPHVKYLAIGSSQAYAVFDTYAKKHKDFSLFTLPAMSTLDYMLYKNYISHLGPERLLLYLSEFDIARVPPFNAYKHAPPQGTYWPELYSKIRARSRWHESNRFITDMLIGEVLPEYKYSFVFRSLANKLLGNRDLVQERDHADISRNALLHKQLKNLSHNIQEEGIGFNLAFLDDFLSFCERQGIKIVIIEGQYKPTAYNKKTAVISRRVRLALQSLAKAHANTLFLPRRSVYEFTNAQYRDIYHVYPDAGLVFTNILLKDIETIFKKRAPHTPV